MKIMIPNILRKYVLPAARSPAQCDGQLRRKTNTLMTLAFSGLMMGLSPGVVSAETISLFDDDLPQATVSLSTNNNGFRSQTVRIDTSPFDVFKGKEGELASRDILDTINIALFDGEVVAAIYERFEIGSGGSVIWIGHVDGQQSNPVMLAINGSVTQGNITLNGERYELRYISGAGNQALHALKHVDPSEARQEHDPSVPLPVGEPNDTAFDSPSTSGDDSGGQIDVLVVWTPVAETAAGGEAAMITLVDLAISESNIAFANSGVIPRLNLVHAEKITYTTVSFGDDLSRLRSTTDGHMDSVHALRDTHSADLVALLISDPQYCGIAYTGPNGTPVAATSAFSVTAWNCATGYYSFGHEFGHNVGALHDRQTHGVLGSSTGHWYGHYAASENWRTIMSYNNADCQAAGNCTRLNYWSNPATSHPTTGTPMGVAEGTVNAAENWKIWNSSAYAVANYRLSTGDSYEIDDDETQASTLFSGSPQTSHSIHDGGADIDWMTFDLTCASSWVTLETSGPSGDTRMWLYDASLTEIAFNDDNGSLFSTINAPGLGAGTYFVKVDEYNNNNTINDYALAFDAICDDDVYEDDDTFALASVIVDGVPQTGHNINDGGTDLDYATFTLTCDADVVIETSGSSTSDDTVLTLYDSGQTLLAENDDFGVGLYSQISMTLAPGSYYIVAQELSYSLEIADYTLSYDHTCVVAGTPDDIYEPNDSFAAASTISNGVPQAHNINEGGADLDYSTFVLDCDADVTLATSGSSTVDNTLMALYDGNQSWITEDTSPGYSAISTQLTAGTYYFEVREYGTDDEIEDYTLSYDRTCLVIPTTTCNGLPITVDMNLGQTTTPGDDVVLGTPGIDDIRGKAGNDTICGMGGDDFIHGNAGDDWIDGGDGVDFLRGGQGNDVVYTGDGGTNGPSVVGDYVFGGNGVDLIVGGPDADDLRGGRGNDEIYGNGGDDEITGNADDDYLFGGDGNDTVKGGNGENDVLAGDAGDDSLNGGGGANDSCYGGGQAGDTDTNCEVFP